MSSLVFDQSSYGPTDVIHFQVVVDQAMTSTATFSGTVTLANGQTLPEAGSTTVSGVYGAFSGPGYTVVQSISDPSQYTATPAS